MVVCTKSYTAAFCFVAVLLHVCIWFPLLVKVLVCPPSAAVEWRHAYSLAKWAPPPGKSSSATPQPFRVRVTDKDLADLKERLSLPPKRSLIPVMHRNQHTPLNGSVRHGLG